LYQHITVICCEETRTDWERNAHRWGRGQMEHS